MANTLYPKYKEGRWTGASNITTDPVKAVLVPASYVYSGAHEFLSDIGTTIGTPQALASKTVALGVLDADDVVFPAVTMGSTVQATVLFNDTGVPGTSKLIGFFDDITGFPLATSGADVTVQWSNGPYKIVSF